MTATPLARKRLAFGLYGVAAASLAFSLVVAGMAAPASAVVPGTDWGPQGRMEPTSSAVTVNWDNSGSTPAVDQVPRNTAQVLPHTGGATYADVDAATSRQIVHDFAGMSLSVTQTQGLRHQAVNLTITGIQPGPQAPAQTNGVMVMQCWGAADQAQPDPENCQDGVGTVDPGSYSSRLVSSGDFPLVSGSDYRAATTVTLYWQAAGLATQLRARVYATGTQTPSDVAVGAAGGIQFYDNTGSAVGHPVPVANGEADLTVKSSDWNIISGYTAKYVASTNDGYLDSLPSNPLSYSNSPLPPTATSGAGANLAPTNRTSSIPFRPVGGSPLSTAFLAQYFTKITTNEIGSFQGAATVGGSASRSFELQTGAESPGLGCGKRADQVSTSVCWLVAIPIDYAVSSSFLAGAASPLTPTLWAQRLQVKLAFADIAAVCTNGDRQVSIGSELVVDAMNSWIPALCNNGSSSVNLGFVQTDDFGARSQYAQGTTALAFTSSPVDDKADGTSTLYAPVGLSGVAIGVLAVDPHGQPITGIKLNARLVAKLLTESYQKAIDNNGQSSVIRDVAPWVTQLPTTLALDPEFQAINPGLGTGILIGTDLIVTAASTDASVAVWHWLLSDPDSRSFLDGCPDQASNNTVINPFYSTRTYAECQGQKAALETTAARWRSDTTVPSTYVDGPAVYPPNGAAFPLTGWYEEPAQYEGDQLKVPALTLADMHPRESSFGAVATDAFRGQEKGSQLAWCDQPVNCSTAVFIPPGVWVNTVTPVYGSGVLGLTTTTAAAKNLLPTAVLCDDTGVHCVGASNQSLQAAAAQFTPSPIASHFLQPPSTVNLADGAYPLTLPVYAEINTKGLAPAAAAAYAQALTFMTAPGQQQGYGPGNLPPGMAPLSSAMAQQSGLAIATLDGIAATPTAAPTPTPTATLTPTATATATAPPSAAATPTPSPTAPSPAVPPVQPPATATPAVTTAPVDATAAAAITPAQPVGPLPGTVIGGLVIALASGIAAPIVGRRRKVRP